MSDCLRDDELAGFAERAKDDPRRMHAQACPRCRARLIAWQAFERAETLPGARPAEAREVLGRRVGEALSGGGLGAPARSRPRPRLAWPGLALAAAVAIVTGVALTARLASLRTSPSGSGSGIERGSGPIDELVTRPPRVEADRLVFRWAPVSGAHYRVRLLGGDMATLFETAEIADTISSLRPASELPEGSASRMRYWQLVARLPDGREIESSPEVLPAR